MTSKQQNSSSLMAIIARQKIPLLNDYQNVDILNNSNGWIDSRQNDEIKLDDSQRKLSNQVKGICEIFESNNNDREVHRVLNLDLPCQSGNVANIRTKLSPVISNSFLYNQTNNTNSYISVNSILSGACTDSDHSDNLEQNSKDNLNGHYSNNNDIGFENLSIKSSENGSHVYETVKEYMEEDDIDQPLQFNDENENPEDLCHTYNPVMHETYENSKRKYKRKLKDCINELIQTEVTYVKRLEIVVNEFLPLLDRKDTPRSAEFEKENIFGNIEDISHFHRKNIFVQFKKFRRSLTRLANVFVTHESSFMMYVFYSMNYKEANRIVFNNLDFFEKKRLELNLPMNLTAYLLEPVQRLSRYKMMLENLLKFYESYAEAKKIANDVQNDENIDDEDDEGEDKTRSAFNTALATIKRILDLSDENVVISNIKKSRVNLTQQGLVKRHDEFTVTDSHGKRHQMRCFLMEKMVVLTTIEKHIKEADSYFYYDSIPMDELGFFPPENKGAEKFCIFRAKMNSKMYTLEGVRIICQNWVDILAQLLWGQATLAKEKVLKEKALKAANTEEQYNDSKDTKASNDRKGSSLGNPDTSLTMKPSGSNSLIDIYDTSEDEKTDKSDILRECWQTYSSLRGVGGEMKSKSRPPKRRTTWYIGDSRNEL